MKRLTLFPPQKHLFQKNYLIRRMMQIKKLIFKAVFKKNLDELFKKFFVIFQTELNRIKKEILNRNAIIKNPNRE